MGYFQLVKNKIDLKIRFNSGGKPLERVVLFPFHPFLLNRVQKKPLRRRLFKLDYVQLLKCRNAGYLSTQNEKVNIVCAFIGDHRFQIHHVSHNRIFTCDAHSAMYLTSFSGNL